jgi:hypothetical protein
MLKTTVVLLLGLAAAGCATTQARAPVERPALDVPPVPARVIEPAPLPPRGPEPVADLPPENPTTNPRPRPQQPPRDPKPDPKVEAAPADPAKPPTQTPPAQAPVPPLRTQATPDGAQAARQIQEINERALRTLNTLDYQKLSDERKAQWQNAKLLISQSEDALKAANLEFAKNLAEKAERLANELRGS